MVGIDRALDILLPLFKAKIVELADLYSADHIERVPVDDGDENLFIVWVLKR